MRYNSHAQLGTNDFPISNGRETYYGFGYILLKRMGYFPTFKADIYKIIYLQISMYFTFSKRLKIFLPGSER